MKKTLLLPLVALGTLLATGSAFAQYTVQLGVANVDPGANASPTTGSLTPPNALSLNVKSQVTAFFSVSRAIDDNWDVQLALGAPPVHDITLKVVNASSLPPSVASQNGQKIGTVSQVAPTMFANYKFGGAADAFRPFIGVGVNYTAFTDPKSNSLNDSINGGPTNSKLTDSWGLAAQVGAVYKLNGPWSVSATWSTADVKTTLTTNTLGIERKTEIKFSPSVFILAVGYSF